jgi:hypothetical protein
MGVGLSSESDKINELFYGNCGFVPSLQRLVAEDMRFTKNWSDDAKTQIENMVKAKNPLVEAYLSGVNAFN